MPLLIPFILGGVTVGSLAWWLDQPETVNNYNIPQNPDQSVLDAIEQSRPISMGEGLSDIGGGLKYAALAAAAIYFYNRAR